MRDIKGRSIRSKEKKKNNVVIIISGEESEDIKEELLLMIRKMSRKKELGFYMSWENAYITGDGMGNYEVILDAANGIVNGFTFRDYCAYVS